MTKDNVKALTGNEAAAYAMKQINPDVVGAYPITPQTSLMQKFAQFVSDGEVDSEVILVESEHSAMSSCVGAAVAGARVMTATSANGLALMFEILYIASGLRLPIVMVNVNRAISAPINIHCDHTDSMGARDSGWIQIFSENAQEAYENVLQAVRIAEHKDVLTPVMVCHDGFIVSHAMENVELFDDEKVKKFVGEYTPYSSVLNLKKPVASGPLVLPDYQFEMKRQEAQGMINALTVIKEIGLEFEKTFGKKYAHIEEYKTSDADAVLVIIGSTAGTAKHVVNTMRKEGKKVGVLKIRTFRPFPVEDIVNALKNVKVFGVMDRSDGVNAAFGPLGTEIRSALYGKINVPMVDFIHGLGGRDVTVDTIKEAFDKLFEVQKTNKTSSHAIYLGVRE